MSGLLMHKRSSVAGAIPLPSDMHAGGIAINHADKAIYILDSVTGNVVKIAQYNFGTTKSVNGNVPDGNGNVLLTLENLGATVTGAQVARAANASAARTALGATAIGDSIFTAVDAAAVRTLLGVASSMAVGMANGIAPLGADSKVPLSFLPDALLGSVQYQTTYNAATNTPAIPNAAASNKGWYYVATVAGTYTPPTGSPVTLEVGDWILSDGSKWARIDAQDAVTSVAGRQGAIVLTTADIASGIFNAAQLGANNAASMILATDSNGAPRWLATIPAANLPLATTSAPGAMQVGSGLLVSSGVVSVDPAALTMDEGTY